MTRLPSSIPISTLVEVDVLASSKIRNNWMFLKIPKVCNETHLAKFDFGLLNIPTILGINPLASSVVYVSR